MIYLPVQGGLGNQMFFYAFKIYLNNRKHKVKFLWYYYISTKQHYGIELGTAFYIDLDFTKAEQYIDLGNRLRAIKVRRILTAILHKIYSLLFRTINQTTPYSFESVDCLTLSNNILLVGFWQNAKYYEECRTQILSAFRFRIPETWNSISHTKILATESVSIHVRRGDYLNKEFSDLNVIVGPNYYDKAIAYIKSKLANPHFFIFTDDIPWCEENFVGTEYTIVSENRNRDSYLDMYMMSSCKHNVIANSSFSWWGAWLNKNNGNIVIAPSMWTKSIRSQSVCPSNWTLISI